MEEGNYKKEDFKRTLSIVTKTISKNKKIEINFENKNSSINGNIVNIKEFPGNLSIKNIQNSLIAFKAIAAIALSVAFGSWTYLP